ncbi:hypothetical protein D3C73_594760 [compost metagenome]
MLTMPAFLRKALRLMLTMLAFLRKALRRIKLTNSSTILTFIVVSFCLALILILKKDTISAPFKRYLALLAIVMIMMSFVLIILSYFGMGS